MVVHMGAAMGLDGPWIIYGAPWEVEVGTSVEKEKHSEVWLLNNVLG